MSVNQLQVANTAALNWQFIGNSQLSINKGETKEVTVKCQHSNTLHHFEVKVKHDSTLDVRTNTRFGRFLNKISFGLYRGHGAAQIKEHIATFVLKQAKEGADVLAPRKVATAAQTKHKKKRTYKIYRDEQQEHNDQQE
ncbi:MAG: hypothetical protein ACPGUD_14295 [Parashewanella sp.]